MSDKEYYLEKWSGEFGDDYTERCDVDYRERVDIFDKLLAQNDVFPIESILEVGCNKGHNLDAFYDIFDGEVYIQGIEPNKSLCKRANIINANAYNIPFGEDVFSLVFTSGVLIHIPKDNLIEALTEIRRVSSKYVMFIEYFSEKEEGRVYREFEDKEGVWGRPYGDIYEKEFKEDKLIKTGKISDIGDDGWGFTKCHYWIYEKK